MWNQEKPNSWTQRVKLWLSGAGEKMVKWGDAGQRVHVSARG